MTVTTDSQVEFDGLELFGTGFELQAIEGLADMPGVRAGDLVVAGRDGSRGGTDYLESRTITVTVVVFGDTEAEFRANVAALRAAFQPTRAATKLLRFKIGGLADDEIARVECRVRAASMPIVSDWFNGVAEAVVQLVAPDPLVYGDTLHSETTTLPTTEGGLEFPVEFPITFGAVSTGGRIVAENAGTWETGALIRLDGPATTPRVENVTTGQTIELDMTIVDGDFVVIDTAARTIMLNGTSSRYSTLTADSEWFMLQPGDNELTFRAPVSSAATMTVAWRSAWL